MVCAFSIFSIMWGIIFPFAVYGIFYCLQLVVKLNYFKLLAIFIVDHNEKLSLMKISIKNRLRALTVYINDVLKSTLISLKLLFSERAVRLVKIEKAIHREADRFKCFHNGIILIVIYFIL